MLTIEQAQVALHNSEYREEGSRELFKQMKAAGLVAVFGASDDLMEFRGAIHDEVGCFDGGKAKITPAGLPECKCEAGDDCPYFKQTLKGAREIAALWCDKKAGCSWSYKTDIPHVTFDVLEDGELYCRGIIFKMADVAVQA